MTQSRCRNNAETGQLDEQASLQGKSDFENQLISSMTRAKAAMHIDLRSKLSAFIQTVHAYFFN